MDFAMVLSDSLYTIWHNFMHGKNFGAGKTEKLLNLLQVPVLTNVNQLKRVGVNNPPLEAALASSGFTGQSLEELVKKTLFKIILSEKEDTYPYVNIFRDDVRSSFTMSFMPGIERKKGIDYLRAQLESAKSVFIYDKYLSANWQNTKKFFTELVPKRAITVFYSQNQLVGQKISELKQICDKWNFAQDRTNTDYRDLHDRYLLVDSCLEVILTSGFDNLFDHRSECTIVFRKLKKLMSGN